MSSMPDHKKCSRQRGGSGRDQREGEGASSSGAFFRDSSPTAQWHRGAAKKKFQKKAMGKFFSTVPSQIRGRRARGGVPQEDLEQDGGNQAHGGAHDGHRPALAEETAEVGVVLSGVTVLLGEAGPHPVAPQIGDDQNDDSHKDRLPESLQEDGEGQIAQSARLELDAQVEGGVVQFHSQGHGVGHENAEENALCFGLDHNCLLKQKFRRYKKKKRTTSLWDMARFAFCYTACLF